MKTQLLILACSSFILFGCNKNTASQHSKDATETQAASAPTTIDPDRQQLMDELAEYKDNPDIPPVQEKLARAYYQMLKTGGGDLEEIRGFISELQDTEQATVEQAAQETSSANEQFEIRLSAKPLPDATAHYAATIINRLEVTSLNDTSTSITSVKVNRGNCPVGGGENYKNMQYGTVAEIIIRCDARQVREVTLTTSSGEYTYNFNGQ
jgi:mannitol-1-phosphate/altronate dehydrogenase